MATNQELLRECMKAAVKLAFIRHDLEIDGDLDITQEEVAEDAAGACFGENTECGKPIPEVAQLVKRMNESKWIGT